MNKRTNFLILFAMNEFDRLEVILFRKENKSVIYFCLFSFLSLLPIFSNARLHTTLSVYEQGAIDFILGAKIWLYCLDCAFWQTLIQFLFVVFTLTA